MATIKYGKGKTLQPTSAAALRAAAHENARAGRVEMPDGRQNRKDSKQSIVDELVRFNTGATDAGHAKDVATGQATVAAPLKTKRLALKARKAGVIAGEKKEVRVSINAPDVLHFFSTRKTKTFSD